MPGGFINPQLRFALQADSNLGVERFECIGKPLALCRHTPKADGNATQPVQKLDGLALREVIGAVQQSNESLRRGPKAPGGVSIGKPRYIRHWQDGQQTVCC